MVSLEDIQRISKSLKPTATTVTSVSGETCIERRKDGGSFEQLEEPESNVSNRRKKKVDRLRRFGFVVDLKPDLEVAKVTDSLFVGSQDVASDYHLLKSHGCTHIVNVASQVPSHFPKAFEYLTVEVLDLPDCRIVDHFDAIFDFIQKAIENNGKVFVHCNAGISRSTTIVIGYLMKTRRIGLNEALEEVKKVRSGTKPNSGFMEQLKEYEIKLQS